MKRDSHILIPYLRGAQFRIARGNARDYNALAPFHYLDKRPATFAGVWVVRYRDPSHKRERAKTVAVLVLSWPVPSSIPREAAMGRLGKYDRRANLRFANRHIRTISRVIVHPQFRSLGLASRLIRWVCEHCKTRYVEAFALMGRAHPMFEKAGMKRIPFPRELSCDDTETRPVYYLYDREHQ